VLAALGSTDYISSSNIQAVQSICRFSFEKHIPCRSAPSEKMVHSAELVFPHHFGPSIRTAPLARKNNFNFSSEIRVK